MRKLFAESQTVFDEGTKILSGPELKLYYDRNCSYGRIAFEELRRKPNHICQICDSENTRLTDKDILLQGIRLARYFESLGLTQDDIIGYSALNTTYAMSVPLACLFTGIACHAVNPNHDKAVFKQLFNKTRPKIIFCDGQNIEKVKFASSDYETKIVTLSNHVKNVPTILDFLKPTGDEHTFQPAELKYGPDQTAFLLCTSGSTGTPKIVIISNLSPIGRTVNNLMTIDDVQFVSSTLDWISSLMGVMWCLVFGITRIITNKPLTAEYFCEIVEKYKVTLAFNGPPTTVMIFTNPNINPKKLDSLHFYAVGGGVVSPNVLQKAQKCLRNGIISQGYGSTELTAGLSINSNPHKLNSIGQINPGFKVRIVNDKGKTLGKNEVGELYVKTWSIWRGYYNDPDATREVYDVEGWLHTGDLCYIGDDNDLYFAGRKKELLKYNTMHYYPKDIEDIIMGIPDVKEVCVFGIEDEVVGDKAAAAIVKVKGSNLKEQDVVDYVRKTMDAEHKQLHAGCKFFEELPKGVTAQKYDRNAAKKLFLNKS